MIDLQHKLGAKYLTSITDINDGKLSRHHKIDEADKFTKQYATDEVRVKINAAVIIFF